MSNLAERKQGEAMFAWRERLRWAVLSLLALVVLAGAAPTGAAEEEKGTVSMTSDANMAANILPCSVDTVPMKIIYGERPSPVTTLSAAQLPPYPPGFSKFVPAVMEHIAAKLAQEKLCLNSAESQERSLIQFVHLPISIAEDSPLVAMSSFETQPSASADRLSSPWIDIAIERDPVPSVRAIVRFNERQFLADQAVLAGASDVPPSMAMPLKYGELGNYESEYVQTEIRHRPTATPIEERLPPDILWLFRRVADNERAGPFDKGVGHSLRQVMETVAESYTKIVGALIDHCFVSAVAEVHYNNILDVGDLVSLEQYKSTMPIFKRHDR